MSINLVGSTNSCPNKHEQNIRPQERVRRNGHSSVKEQGPDIMGSKYIFSDDFKTAYRCIQYVIQYIHSGIRPWHCSWQWYRATGTELVWLGAFGLDKITLHVWKWIRVPEPAVVKRKKMNSDSKWRAGPSVRIQYSLIRPLAAIAEVGFALSNCYNLLLLLNQISYTRGRVQH
jgi:hypothetical protein